MYIVTSNPPGGWKVSFRAESLDEVKEKLRATFEARTRARYGLGDEVGVRAAFVFARKSCIGRGFITLVPEDRKFESQSFDFQVEETR